ncbi:hypothetical protein B0H14DRAFT_3640833 [Mycena olivaceomarginata]|nr:hypothetical protein B0H14DRAFT_3640833 [Mycena olivaceomarginata]
MPKGSSARQIPPFANSLQLPIRVSTLLHDVIIVARRRRPLRRRSVPSVATARPPRPPLRASASSPRPAITSPPDSLPCRGHAHPATTPLCVSVSALVPPPVPRAHYRRTTPLYRPVRVPHLPNAARASVCSIQRSPPLPHLHRVCAPAFGGPGTRSPHPGDPASEPVRCTAPSPRLGPLNPPHRACRVRFVLRRRRACWPPSALDSSALRLPPPRHCARPPHPYRVCAARRPARLAVGTRAPPVRTCPPLPDAILTAVAHPVPRTDPCSWRRSAAHSPPSCVSFVRVLEPLCLTVVYPPHLSSFAAPSHVDRRTPAVVNVVPSPVPRASTVYGVLRLPYTPRTTSPPHALRIRTQPVHTHLHPRLVLAKLHLGAHRRPARPPCLRRRPRLRLAATHTSPASTQQQMARVHRTWAGLGFQCSMSPMWTLAV